MWKTWYGDSEWNITQIKKAVQNVCAHADLYWCYIGHYILHSIVFPRHVVPIWTIQFWCRCCCCCCCCSRIRNRMKWCKNIVWALSVVLGMHCVRACEWPMRPKTLYYYDTVRTASQFNGFNYNSLFYRLQRFCIRISFVFLFSSEYSLDKLCIYNRNQITRISLLSSRRKHHTPFPL